MTATRDRDGAEGGDANAAEQWRQVTGHHDYIVSNLGRVSHRHAAAPCLDGHVDNDGYRRVRIDGVQYRVHRLVCAAFHGPAPEGTECAHSDGNRLNNTANNLSWKTAKENNADKILHGTHQSGAQHPRAKLTPEQVEAIRASGLSSRTLAREYGVNQSQIVRIKNGKRWAEGIAKIEHDINLLKRIELEIVESISLINQRTQLLSISPEVEELRRDVGEGNADANP